MKIFAYNLCLQFEVRKTDENFSFSTISFPDLMNQLFKGMEFDSQVFYLEADHSESFLDNIFDLQTNDIWRNLSFTIVSVFPSEASMSSFLEAFRDRFRQIDAAGGLVTNDQNQYLLIYNRDMWTLPKGLVEWREEIEHAAVREVQEETGLKQVEILHEIPSTFHTFRSRKKWVLKTTYWYKMKAAPDQELVPRLEEKIMDAKWVTKEEWLDIAKTSYPLTREIFEQEFVRSLASP